MVLRKKNLILLALAIILSLHLYGEDKGESSVKFSGIPAFGFGSDSGIGGGVIGNMYVHEPGFDPYRTALGLKIKLTTKLINSHELKVDHLQAFGLPWRIFARVGLYSTRSQNFSGLGSNAKQEEGRPEIEAANLGLSGDERSEFIKRYYQHRYISIFGDTLMRWLLWKDQAKLELMGSYRGRYYINSDFKNRGAYKNSLFDKTFKNKKTEGYLSTLEVGLMLDKRDNEPAPTSGYWIESSVRGAASFIGSSWDYFGGNISARFYLPVDSEHKIVVASQTIVDGIVGDLPFDAMSRTGGSSSVSDQNAIGGQDIGRGIKEQMYVGRFKAIEQLEFRYTFWSFKLFKQNFDLTGAAFGDMAVTSWDYDSNFKSEIGKIHTGFGGGLRINWNKTFVIRADLGVSPAENFSPRMYLVVGNIF